MFLVGLTGGIATGKSTVSKNLQELGIPVIDADQVAREVVEPGKPAWRKIKETFGDAVITADGAIDRAVLGEIIFNNAEKRKKLNAITHPHIYKAIFRKCISLMLSGNQFAVLDLPLLFESGYMVPFLHKIIVVRCGAVQQLERLMARNALSRQDAEVRINSQMSLDEKCARAHYVIDNSGDPESTLDQVVQIVDELQSSWTHWKYRAIIATGIVIAAGSVTLLARWVCSLK